MARDELPNGKKADFCVNVEDEPGTEIYRTDLSFNARTADDIQREGEESDATAAEIAARKLEP